MSKLLVGCSVLFLLSCVGRQETTFAKETRSLQKALENFQKDKLTTETTHVLIVPLQGCGGCTSQLLANYRTMVTDKWLVVFCASDPVVARGMLHKYEIQMKSVLVDTKNVMVRNGLVDNAPVVYKTVNKEITQRYVFDPANFSNSLQSVWHGN